MGQYFKIANIDKKETIDPHVFGDGMKLLEFGCSAQGTMTGLTFLLRKSSGLGGGDVSSGLLDKHKDIVGRWSGDKIVIIGDYDESELAKMVWNEDTEFTDISKDLREAMNDSHFISLREGFGLEYKDE